MIRNTTETLYNDVLPRPNIRDSIEDFLIIFPKHSFIINVILGVRTYITKGKANGLPDSHNPVIAEF